MPYKFKTTKPSAGNLRRLIRARANAYPNRRVAVVLGSEPPVIRGWNGHRSQRYVRVGLDWLQNHASACDISQLLVGH